MEEMQKIILTFREGITRMNALFTNTTKLTEDMCQTGIVKYYKATHKFLRAISTAYALIMLYISYAFFLTLDLTVAIPFLIFGIVILFWNYAGYSFTANKSFKKFVVMHNSHYYVIMTYRFYEDRFEQETTKTKMTILYKDFSEVYNMEKMLLFIYNKQVIIMDKTSFEPGILEQVLNFIKSKNIKIKTLKC